MNFNDLEKQLTTLNSKILVTQPDIIVPLSEAAELSCLTACSLIASATNLSIRTSLLN